MTNLIKLQRFCLVRKLDTRMLGLRFNINKECRSL